MLTIGAQILASCCLLKFLFVVFGGGRQSNFHLIRHQSNSTVNAIKCSFCAYVSYCFSLSLFISFIPFLFLILFLVSFIISFLIALFVYLTLPFLSFPHSLFTYLLFFVLSLYLSSSLSCSLHMFVSLCVCRSCSKSLALSLSLYFLLFRSSVSAFPLSSLVLAGFCLGLC